MGLRYSIHLLLCLLPAVLNQTALASSARFIVPSNLLELDCVRITDEADRTLTVDLRYDGSSFSLISATDIDTDSSCPVTFDSQSGLLSAEVRVADDVYQLELKYEGDTLFSVQSAELLGAGENLLWKVSNGTHEVVIGGTVHILKPNDFPLPSAYTDAFNQADVLVTEISSAEYNNTLAIAPFLNNPPGTPGLSAALSTETYEQLSLYFIELGIPIANLENLRPVWIAQEILVQAWRELGYGNGVDLHFINLALSRGIPSLGLETAADQASALSQTGQNKDTETLIADTLALIQSPGFGSDIQKLMNAWREADIQELNETVIIPAREESLADYNLIYTNRNMNWVPQIEAFLQTAEKEFVLVGAGHLVGAESVLVMLEALGLEVTRF